MQELEYRVLDSEEGFEWDQVEDLFRQMYAYMEEKGLQLPLQASGPRTWVATARNTAEKFGRVAVAVDNENVVGFAHGMIKFLPDYLGGQPVGSISHVFVEEEYRDKQVGSRLVELLEDWFRIKNVHSVELQVISGNPGAMRFWEGLGYAEELKQYRKPLL